MTPTAGQMNMKITFNIPVKVSDLTGGQDEAYDDFYTTRGYLKKISGTRSFQSGYDQSVNRYEMWTWWRHVLESNISKDMRVIYDNREFSVDHYDLIEEQRRMYHFELTEVR